MSKKSSKQKINLGQFHDTIYVKYLKLNEAVLWKDRQLSIPKHVFIGLTANSTTEMRFIDRGKGEMWVFSVEKVKAAGEWKQVGQEEQFYFPIELAKKVEVQKSEVQDAK